MSSKVKMRRFAKREECYWCGRLVWIGRTIILGGPAKQRVRECRKCTEK